jgi:hypothetical protein
MQMEASGKFEFRTISKEDRTNLEAHGLIVPKGAGGTPDTHVSGGDTHFLSLSKTLAGTKKYRQGSSGVAVVQIAQVDPTDVAGVDYVRIAVTNEQLVTTLKLDKLRDFSREAHEELVVGPIPMSAIVYLGPTPLSPEERKQREGAADRRGGKKAAAKSKGAEQVQFDKLCADIDKGKALSKIAIATFDKLAKSLGHPSYAATLASAGGGGAVAAAAAAPAKACKPVVLEED